MQPLICFVSDFGIGDTWVGVCHAVIHRACQQVKIVDLSHAVAPFDVRQGAVVAAEGVYQIPDAIHLVVVDPGVGGGRLDLCVRCASGTVLVGPDNGVLMPAARRCGGIVAAYGLDPGKIDAHEPLATFHARDVLAPAAAALACGVSPEALGVVIDPSDLVPAPFGECVREGDRIHAEVLGHDRFGSIRLNIPEECVAGEWVAGDTIVISAVGRGVEQEVLLGTTFCDVDPGDPIALFDSSGWLTLSVNLGSAAHRFGLGPGDMVTLTHRAARA